MTIALAKPPAKSRSLTEPRIIEMPDERMAVVETKGDPNQVGKQVIPALFGAVYGLKFSEKKQGRDFKVRPLRARWFNWQAGKPADLRGLWGLPVPPLTRAIPQKFPETRVELQTWRYGTVAEILHLGAYSAEQPSIQHLMRFVEQEGYEIDGPHEEEYLSRPNAREPKTLIRYRIKKAEHRSADRDRRR